MSGEIIQGNKRMERESFIAYKERQKRESRAIKSHLKGGIIWNVKTQGTYSSEKHGPLIYRGRRYFGHIPEAKPKKTEA